MFIILVLSVGFQELGTSCYHYIIPQQIIITEKISFKQEKGFDDEQFYSDISLHNEIFGVSATLTAYAETVDMAKTVAFVYLGRMVDVLILDNDLPIVLQEHGNPIISKTQTVTRRQFKKREIESAFKVVRKLELGHKDLLKAIGWYSKGKNSINALDSFLSYWNVLEIVGKKYCTETARTLKGVKNKIFQCFLDYFGSIDEWNLPDMWIDKMYDNRNSIVHGGEEATSESINNIAVLIPLLSQTARRIITTIIDAKYPDDIWTIVGHDILPDFF